MQLAEDTVAAEGLQLRQVREQDRWLLWQWRNSERIRKVSTNDKEIPRSSHGSWFDEHFEGMRDRTIIVTWNGEPVGWYQIENWDTSKQSGEWGYAIGRTAGTVGLGAMLPLLGLGHAFDRLNAKQMTGRVLDINSNVLSLLQRFEIPIYEKLTDPIPRDDGTATTMTVYRVLVADWPAIRANGLQLLPPGLRSSLTHAFESPIAE